MVIPCYNSKGDIEGVLLVILTELARLLPRVKSYSNKKDSLSCLFCFNLYVIVLTNLGLVTATVNGTNHFFYHLLSITKDHHGLV